jgi:hypothetical protein
MRKCQLCLNTGLPDSSSWQELAPEEQYRRRTTLGSAQKEKYKARSIVFAPQQVTNSVLNWEFETDIFGCSVLQSVQYGHSSTS